MRALVAVMVLSVAAFHNGLSASLEGAEKEEKVVHSDVPTELQKVDQMEFEAAQKEAEAQRNDEVHFEAAQKEDTIHVNVTVGDSEDTRYLEAVKDGCVEERQGSADVSTGGDETPEAAALDEAESKSSEETEGRVRHDMDTAHTV